MTIASLIEICQLKAVDPRSYLTATLTAIVHGHKQSQINELPPWQLSCLTQQLRNASRLKERFWMRLLISIFHFS